MKTHIVITAACIMLNIYSHAQSVAINTDATPADTSAILDVKSNIKGLLTPRMSTAERQAIVLAATGLLVFDTDTLTFWFYNGTNWVEFGSGSLGGFWLANGADIYNSNTGNVGIGISTPLAPLHIKNNLEAMRLEGSTPYIGFYDNDATTVRAFVQNYNDDLYFGTPATNTLGKMEFYLQNTPVVTMLPNGNVGIGTPTPRTKLTMETPYNTSGWYHIARNGTDSIVVGEGIGGVSAGIGTATEHILRITAGALGRIQVIPDGNVIVGDNFVPPFGRLTVRTPNNSWGISHTSDGGNILATQIGGTSAGIGTFSNTHMRIFANSVSAITITGSNGNVGIGTEFQAYKLAVNGTIRAKEVIVETGWADYVFDEKYQLPSLESVEEHIKKNKHLPGVPSAAAIQNTGLGLGEVQTKMMEKIEELTLYIIALNKEIGILKTIVEAKK